MHQLFFKKVLIILRYSTKHANFWLGVQYPLIHNTINSVLLDKLNHVLDRSKRFFIFRQFLVGMSPAVSGAVSPFKVPVFTSDFNSGCLYQWESRDSSATRIFF